MDSIASSTNSEQALNDAWEQLARADRRIALLDQELKFIREIISLPNKHLSPSHKVVFLALYHIITGLREQGQGAVKISMGEVEEATGLKRGAIGDAMKYLEQVGYIKRTIEIERIGKGQMRTHVYVELTMFAYYAGSLLGAMHPHEERNHGGKRQKCPYCGSEDLWVRKEVLCNCCKKSISATLEPVNGQEFVLREAIDDGDIENTPF